jgi:hypothetical protein
LIQRASAARDPSAAGASTEEHIVTKRQASSARAKPRTTRPPEGVAETAAAYVGRTLGELINRKDELQKQLSQVEAQIARASVDMTARLRQYVPKSVSRLLGKKTRKPAPRKASRRTARPATPHGRDRESAAAKVAEKRAAATDRTQRAAHPRSAPRAARRG